MDGDGCVLIAFSFLGEKKNDHRAPPGQGKVLLRGDLLGGCFKWTTSEHRHISTCPGLFSSSSFSTHSQ
ncbi:rCG57149 [Rattus norvegicus]|uniref:RCG57149 n=1 Tax=Rattus norvegicus TaxID=10116 RepID=A6JD03_RAT|nr:rCG57149 [Rattus norvegicus]